MTYAEVLIRKGKRGAAAYVQAECNSAKAEPSKSPQHLNALLDHLLHPEKPIDDQETIDWCRWLVGGGRDFDDFAANGEKHIASLQGDSGGLKPTGWVELDLRHSPSK